MPRLSKKESLVLTACACVKNPSIPGFPYNFGTLSASWMGSDVMFLYRGSTLRQHMMKLKDPIRPQKKANVVYSVPLQCCPAVYVGQTGQQLSTRLQEHKHAVKTADFNASVLAEHAWNKHHQIDWNRVSILTSESNQYCRLTLES